MLNLPEKGISRSIRALNVDRVILGDWIEASALFGPSSISKSHVVDALMEEEICDDQNMAFAIADLGWTEIRSRIRATGESLAIRIEGDQIEKVNSWDFDIARAFLVMLSLFPVYPTWARPHRDAVNQGVLFEKLSVVALKYIFQGWNVHLAGWSPDSPKTVAAIVNDLKDLLPCLGRDNIPELAGDSKDAGLDVICFKTFSDAREGQPIYMIQCASGNDWTGKLHQPKLNIWYKALDYAFFPAKAIMIPFVLEPQTMKQKSIDSEGPLFDRNRILGASDSPEWIEIGLQLDLLSWLEPRVSALPWRS